MLGEQLVARVAGDLAGGLIHIQVGSAVIGDEDPIRGVLHVAAVALLAGPQSLLREEVPLQFQEGEAHHHEGQRIAKQDDQPPALQRLEPKSAGQRQQEGQHDQMDGQPQGQQG